MGRTVWKTCFGREMDLSYDGLHDDDDNNNNNNNNNNEKLITGTVLFFSFKFFFRGVRKIAKSDY
jgi:hypothetical protein